VENFDSRIRPALLIGHKRILKYSVGNRAYVLIGASLG
jgi:hypothetical protein